MVSFGDSKHKPVKPLHRLLVVTPLNLALSAKCTIHDVCAQHEHVHTFVKALKKVETLVPSNTIKIKNNNEMKIQIFGVKQ